MAKRKIALIGYGKMGKTIDQLATAAGHEIVLKVDKNNQHELSVEHLQKADVAIEFTQPDSAVGNIRLCQDAGVPVVVGTTAWLDKLPEVGAYVEEKGGALFYASNFSIGVNIFFAVSRYLAGMMDEQLQYDVRMEEIHHTQKLDAPSGTAITLAEGILDRMQRKQQWVNEATEAADTLPIISKRIDKVPGTHEVVYQSEVDEILIRHTAHSREGFAKGAIQAADWLVGKQGVFSMKDMLGFDL